MGGNALSANVAIRLTKKNADRLAAECVAKLQACYPGRRMAYLTSYHSKPDAGDADILVEADERYDPHQAAAALDAVEVVRNGPVTSLGVIVRPEVPQRDGNVFQVDLIRIAPEEFDYAFSYFNWSDLGNLIGRIAHAGFTAHKHNGLYFYFRDPESPDRLFKEILLTRDHDKALAYLGYESARFKQGFDTLEEIFEYAASSKFFNSAIYLLENRNAAARVRDKKRPAYTGFLKWCEARPTLPAFKFPEDKNAWLPRIAEHFPQFQDEYAQALADLAVLRAVKVKFNGGLVSTWTGLEGKELGTVMAAWRQGFGSSNELHRFILDTDTETLRLAVMATALEVTAAQQA